MLELGIGLLVAGWFGGRVFFTTRSRNSLIEDLCCLALFFGAVLVLLETLRGMIHG